MQIELIPELKTLWSSWFYYKSSPGRGLQASTKMYLPQTRARALPMWVSIGCVCVRAHVHVSVPTFCTTLLCVSVPTLCRKHNTSHVTPLLNGTAIACLGVPTVGMACCVCDRDVSFNGTLRVSLGLSWAVTPALTTSRKNLTSSFILPHFSPFCHCSTVRFSQPFIPLPFTASQWSVPLWPSLTYKLSCDPPA